MMVDADRLFDEFAASYVRGEQPDLIDYLARAGDSADELARLVAVFLRVAPTPEPSDEAVAVMHARLEGEPGLLALRRTRARKVDEVVAELASGLGVQDLPRLKRYYHECMRYREAMLRRIVAMRPAAVILSSWDHYMPTDGKGSEWHVTPEAWREGLRRTYGRIANAGIPVVALRGTPRTWFDVPSCLSRWTAHLPGAQECVYERARSLSPVAADAQTAAAQGLRVGFVDMNDQICPTARCPVMRDGIVVFTDDNHLTASFSRSLATVFGERIERAVESANGR